MSDPDFEDSENQTVAELLGIVRNDIDDFAVFMLGRNRRTFHFSCNVRRNQDPVIYQQCWEVFSKWQAWQEDFYRKEVKS